MVASKLIHHSAKLKEQLRPEAEHTQPGSLNSVSAYWQDSILSLLLQQEQWHMVPFNISHAGQTQSSIKSIPARF